jgi:hypothetical protein
MPDEKAITVEIKASDTIKDVKVSIGDQVRLIWAHLNVYILGRFYAGPSNFDF